MDGLNERERQGLTMSTGSFRSACAGGGAVWPVAFGAKESPVVTGGVEAAGRRRGALARIHDRDATSEPELHFEPEPSHGHRPGFTLMATITAAAHGLRQVPGLSALSPMITAIFIGLAFSSFTTVPAAAKPGVAFFGKHLLRLAIVLLGFQLTLGPLGEVGVVRMLAICVLVAASFLGALASVFISGASFLLLAFVL